MSNGNIYKYKKKGFSAIFAAIVLILIAIIGSLFIYYMLFGTPKGGLINILQQSGSSLQTFGGFAVIEDIKQNVSTLIIIVRNTGNNPIYAKQVILINSTTSLILDIANGTIQVNPGESKKVVVYLPSNVSYGTYKIKVYAGTGVGAMPVTFQYEKPWLDGWNYRRPIIIKERSGSDLVDYQVRIELNTNNFDYSKAKSDGSDIRFTDSDGVSPLPYWIEVWNPSGTSIIWVKIHKIPANSEKTIYMYYGNPNAESESNASAVFIKDKIYLISTVWPSDVDDLGHYADNHDEFEQAIQANPAVFGTGYVDYIDYTENPYGRDDDFMLRFKFLFIANFSGTYYFATDSDDASEIMAFLGDEYTHWYTVIVGWYGGHGSSGYNWDAHYGTLSLKKGQGIWIEYRMQEWDGAQKASMAIKPPGQDWKIVSASNFPGQIFARKYVSPEPSITIGSEETK